MTSFGTFWQEWNDTRNPWRNLAYIILSGLAVSQIDSLVRRIDVDWIDNIIPRVGIALVVLIATWKVFQVIRGGDPLVFKEVMESPGMPALVAFVSVSRGKTPAESAIEFQKAKGVIRFCTILYTDESKDNADAILLHHPLTTDFEIHPKRVEDDRDPDHVYTRVCEAIDAAMKSDHVGSPDQVLVDFTGGTKLATFAMAMAAQDKGASVQYIYTPLDNDKRLDYDRSVPMLLHTIGESQLQKNLDSESGESA